MLCFRCSVDDFNFVHNFTESYYNVRFLLDDLIISRFVYFIYFYLWIIVFTFLHYRVRLYIWQHFTIFLVFVFPLPFLNFPAHFCYLPFQLCACFRSSVVSSFNASFVFTNSFHPDVFGGKSSVMLQAIILIEH